MITHDMAVVREICNEVCVLEEGRIVEKNNIPSILLYPQNTVTKSLIRNLINRDLPHHLQERLRQTPTPQSAALLRLFFSSEAAEEPIIFSIIKKYDIPINILFGNLDHIRETAFGCLIVSIPYEIAKITELMKDLKQRGVSSEIIGYLPQEASDLWNN